MSALAAVAAAPLLAVIAVDDLRHHRIRNRYVLALAAVVAVSAVIAAAGGDRAMAGRATLGAVLASAPLAAVWVTKARRVGGGDVKLAAALGALVGAINPWLAVATVGLGLVGALATALATRRQRVALGPGMVAGALVAVVSFALVAA